MCVHDTLPGQFLRIKKTKKIEIVVEIEIENTVVLNGSDIVKNRSTQACIFRRERARKRAGGKPITRKVIHEFCTTPRRRQVYV